MGGRHGEREARSDLDRSWVRDAAGDGAVTTAQPTVRRTYDNSLRRERAAATRDRIVGAGAELLRGSDIRDWGGGTFGAVAVRAGVNERTVYRHFANERALRDAVMHRFEVDAGVDLELLALDDVGTVAARILRYAAATYPLGSA